MSSEPALVSAVIPTHRRPHLVVRAIESVIRQSYSSIEAVVVIDGNDAETRSVVESLDYPKVRCLATGRQAGPAEARNLGIREAKGRYIALLDDDDEWAPNKIMRQMEIVRAHRLDDREFIVSCRTDYRVNGESRITPTEIYQAPADLSEYLFLRQTPAARPGFIASGSVLFPRALALRLPFPTEAAHEEMGWWLMCVNGENVPLHMAEEAMFIQHIDAVVVRNQTQDWRASLEWAQKYRPYMTGRAFSGLLSSTTAWRAKRQGGLCALGRVAVAMARDGQSLASHWVMLAGIALLPLGVINDWRLRRR